MFISRLSLLCFVFEYFHNKHALTTDFAETSRVCIPSSGFSARGHFRYRFISFGSDLVCTPLAFFPSPSIEAGRRVSLPNFPSLSSCPIPLPQIIWFPQLAIVALYYSSPVTCSLLHGSTLSFRCCVLLYSLKVSLPLVYPHMIPSSYYFLKIFLKCKRMRNETENTINKTNSVNLKTDKLSQTTT